MESLFSEHEKLHRSVLRIYIDGAGDVDVLTDIRGPDVSREEAYYG